MRFKNLGAEEVGESESLRHRDPVTGREELNFTDAELAMTPPLEEEADSRDILPDQIREFRGDDDEDEERELTAQPQEPLRPMRPEELGDD